jgi:hypothetical protein
MSRRIRAPRATCYDVAMKRLVLLLLVFTGCSASPVQHPTQLPDGGYGRFAQHAPGPIVDTRAQSAIRVGLAHSRASWMLVHHFFGRGARPPAGAVRVAEAIAAMVPPVVNASGPRPSITATAGPSPYRPGWQLLVVSVTAPTSSTRLRWTVLSPARDALAEAFVAGGAAYVEGDVGDLPRVLEGTRHVVVVSDAAGFGGPEAQGPLLQSIAKARRGGAVVVAVGRFGPGFDDALLAAIAEVGGGHYEVALPDDATAHRQLAQRVLGPVGLLAATLDVSFDAARVKRWRLVGHDLHTGAFVAPVGGLVPAGETVDVVFEIDGVAGATVALSAHDVAARETLVVAPPDDRHAMVAVVAAFAEKLSGSHWFEDVPWSTLEAELAKVGSPAFRAELGELIGAAKATP